MKKLLILISLVGLVAFSPKAFASSYPHKEWGHWCDWGEWSECKVEAGVCGVYEGTQTRERTRECKIDWSWGSNECFTGQVDTQTEQRGCKVDFGECEVPVVEKVKGFSEDRRCLATTPLAPQWVLKTPEVGGVNLIWSAMGGSKVDIEITNAMGEFEYKIVKTLNDGHEFIPNTSMLQLFRVRVFNECKYGDWLIDP